VALSDALRGLVAWDDPVFSGAVFGLVNAAFGLAAMGRWSAASLIGAAGFYTLFAAAVCTLAVRTLRNFTPVAAMLDSASAMLPAVLQPGGKALVDADLAADAGRLVALMLSEAFGTLQQLASVARPAATAGALLAAYMLKRFGKFMGLLGLFWAAFVAAFTWPLVQSHFGSYITEGSQYLRVQLEELRAQATILAEPILAALPINGLGQP